jgi:hypothetical protein
VPDARRVGGRRTACRCNGYRSRAVAIKLTKWSIYDTRARLRSPVAACVRKSLTWLLLIQRPTGAAPKYEVQGCSGELQTKPSS